jgi:hypothetical protein
MAVTAHAITHGEDGLKAVVLYRAGYLPAPLLANHPEFPDSWLPQQFAFLKNIHQVFVNRSDILLEQFRDLGLGQPEGVVLKPTLDARSPVLCLVEDQLGLRDRFVAHSCPSVGSNSIALAALVTDVTSQEVSGSPEDSAGRTRRPRLAYCGAGAWS